MADNKIPSPNMLCSYKIIHGSKLPVVFNRKSNQVSLKIMATDIPLSLTSSVISQQKAYRDHTNWTSSCWSCNKCFPEAGSVYECLRNVPRKSWTEHWHYAIMEFLFSCAVHGFCKLCIYYTYSGSNKALQVAFITCE